MLPLCSRLSLVDTASIKVTRSVISFGLRDSRQLVVDAERLVNEEVKQLVGSSEVVVADACSFSGI